MLFPELSLTMCADSSAEEVPWMGTGGTSLVGSITPRKNTVSAVSANRAVAQSMSVAANLFIMFESPRQDTPKETAGKLQLGKSKKGCQLSFVGFRLIKARLCLNRQLTTDNRVCLNR